MTVNLKSMRRVIVDSDGKVVVQTAPVPEVGPDEVLVRSRKIGLCGSDVHAAHGRHPFVSLPYAPGHESFGEVAALGSEVGGKLTRNGARIAPGLRVVVEPTLPCWTCKQCRRGEENLCEKLAFFGCVHWQGAMADYYTIPANRLHAISDDLSDDQAVLVEPLATPVHAVRISGLHRGDAVAILGAGTIGLMTLAAARRAGAGRIVVTDVLESKRAIALAMGADAVVDAARPDVAEAVREELGESADVVFDCVSNQSTVNSAVAMALKNGTVVVVGVPAGEVRVPLPQIQDQQVRVQGAATYLPVDYGAAIDMIREGLVRPDDFVTGVFSLDQAPEAFEAASAGSHIKVLVETE